jgi:hypothetical protein
LEPLFNKDYDGNGQLKPLKISTAAQNHETTRFMVRSKELLARSSDGNKPAALYTYRPMNPHKILSPLASDSALFY